jgi:NADPH2:quinone reductase
MQAVRAARAGGVEVLEVVDVPRPVPGRGEVLVEVEAAGVNFADLMIREGGYVEEVPFPVVLGSEAAGRVVELGPDAPPELLDRRVVAFVTGGYSEYAVADAGAAFPIPDALDSPSATAVLIQGLSAVLMLRRVARLAPGESVLVNAAAGGVGSLAVQLAKAFGAGPVIGAAGSPDKLALARELGADVVVDYTRDGWAEEVRAATGGRGVDVVLEMVGGSTATESLSALAPFGRLVTYGQASDRTTPLVMQQLLAANQAVLGFYLGGGGPPEQMGAAAQKLTGLLGTGRIRVVPGPRYPLERAADAHRDIAARRTTGKVTLIPDGRP